MQRSKGKDRAASPPKLPPVNFHVVEENRIYRSGTPELESGPFLTKTLKLKSVITLCPDTYDKCMLKFLRGSKIDLFQHGIAGKIDPSKDPQGGVAAALKVLADKKNHPVLIHCRGGKHRTGCLVGCLRKLQNWNVDKVLAEYSECAGEKARENDIKFLATFDVSGLRSSLGPQIEAW